MMARCVHLCCNARVGWQGEINPGSEAKFLMDLQEIEFLLKKGGCPERCSRERAERIFREVRRLNLPVTLLPPTTIQHGFMVDGSDRFFDLVEYAVGDTGFSIDNASELKIEARNCSGTSFDRGILTYLARVLEIGELIIPDALKNNKAIRVGLQDPKKHLNTLNEIWWLRWWRKAEYIRPSVQLDPVVDTDIDWQFDLGDTFELGGETPSR